MCAFNAPVAETMQLENTVCLWQGGRSGRFQFEGVVRIPESDVRYLPTGWEAFKFAWIQYLAFLVVVGWIAFSLKGLLIQSHLLPTTVSSDTVPKLKQF